MRIYSPGVDEDLLLLNWWTVLGSTRELETVFSSFTTALGGFMRCWAPPTILMYEADEAGIWGACWLDPIHSGAFYGLWIRPDKRRTKTGLKFALESLEYALTRAPVLISLTRDESLFKQTVHLGFTPLQGVIPWVLDGDDARVAYMTSREFNARWRKEPPDGREST